MSDRYDDIAQMLSETKRLLGELEAPTGEEFSVDHILAEFGQSGAEPAQNEESAVAAEEVVAAIPEPEMPKPVSPDTVELPKLKKEKVLQFPRVFAAREEKPAPTPVEEKQAEAEKEDFVPEPPKETHEEVSLEELLSRTVQSALDEQDDVLLDEPFLLRERLGEWGEKLAQVLRPLLKRRMPRREVREETEIPEPEMEQAAKEAKSLSRLLRRQMIFAAVPMVLLAAVSILEAGWPQLFPGIWFANALVRCGAAGGVLVLTCALAFPVWKEAVNQLKQGRFTCDAAAALPVLAVLGDCIGSIVTKDVSYLPLAAPAALLVWLCLAGQYCAAAAAHDAYRLADMGGRPPYAVAVTAAGACKQRGKLQGFYNISREDDPSRRVQCLGLPLLLGAATVLAGVVCLGGERMGEFFRVWSAMLSASVPLGLPLCGTMPVRNLNRRLTHSGCAVAGYAGARAVGCGKRIVLTDQDLFPPGTVSLNGLKTYGEEIGKVVSYAATMTRAAGSPLEGVFEQLLASEGGCRRHLDDLHFYEEGGMGGTIRGETVIMGSAYFMKKMHVTLPRDLKVKTGVFLAVDGQLIAIFAIKYQPSRNVEWALRALRRSRIVPVLAVRSSNITPGLLKRKFAVDAKPIYPDVSTRLALSDLSKEEAARANALIYREGLMPFAETVIGSRRCCRTVRWATVLCVLGGLCGLWLSYYLANLAAYNALNAGYLLVFLLLWLLPTVLLTDLTRRY